MNDKIDLRDHYARKRCKKLIRKGGQDQAEYSRYKPYCSFHCQEWAQLEGAQEYINNLKSAGGTP